MTYDPNGWQSPPPPPPPPDPSWRPADPPPPPPPYVQPLIQSTGPIPAASPSPPRRPSRAPWLLVTVLLVVVVVAFGAIVTNRGSGAPPDDPNQPPQEEPGGSDLGPGAFPSESIPVFGEPSAIDGAPESASPTDSTGPGGSPPSSASTGTPAPPASGSPRTPGPGVATVPIVPVVDFWSTQTSISLDDLKAALSGSAGDQQIAVPDTDADAIAQALGITLGGSVQRTTVDQVAKSVSNGGLGVLRATDVGPSVRALAIDGTALFGNDRVKDVGSWPVSIQVADGDPTWDHSTAWTLVAGGDMFMDRGVYREVVKQHKGVDFPFDGGTATVTGHHCCGQYVTTYEIPDVTLTGNEGVVRSLIKDADLAMANLETPVPDNWVYHAHDYIFSSDPSLLPMFTNAGFDLVTIANNHIKDFGGSGVTGTVKNLEAAGLPSVGAGANLQEAGKIGYLHAADTTVGVIGCQGVQASYYATASSPGALPCDTRNVVPLINQAKQKADLVIVFAHWGVEYQNDPTSAQETLAQAWAKAGAGLILGAHPHVPGAIADIDGTVTFYSLGNFIFDQTFRTATMESALPEMTFQGKRLVQIALHPFVAPDTQPNLLDPATDDGKAVMTTVRKTSQGAGLNW